MQVGEVSGDEGAGGSRFPGGPVQTCRKAGPTRGWAPGNGPPQPRGPCQVLATGHRASLLSGAVWGRTVSPGPRELDQVGASHPGTLWTCVEMTRPEIPQSFL